MSAHSLQEVTVEQLPFFSVQVPSQTLGADIARLLEKNAALPGVIVMQDDQFRGLVSRNQFFQRLGRLFGIEVYFSRPITAYLDSLSTPPLQISAETTIQNAAIICLAVSGYLLNATFMALERRVLHWYARTTVLEWN